MCVCDKKLNKSGKMLYVDVSFHGSLKPTLSCLYYRLSYFSKQRIMERQMLETTVRWEGRVERPFDRKCVTKETIYIFIHVFHALYYLYERKRMCEFFPKALKLFLKCDLIEY